MVENKVNCESTNKNDTEQSDWDLPLAFSKPYHTENIEGINCVAQTWRMKEKMKTVSVALVLCLNVGVDPPDVVKTQPSARLECWIDPLSMSPVKALEAVGNNLQKQYEKWQPRARYKQSLDPTVEEVKKLCTSLRRNAKEERVLFHYNGHGVPKPTTNGEIWVFNRTYTQYIPLSVYDLQTWMGAPSIYVYDCSNAGIIVDSFKQFAEQHEKEYEVSSSGRGASPGSTHTGPSFKNCIQLAACSANQTLPMSPAVPADLFTSCLTTPIKVALRWYVMHENSKLVPKINLELIDKIPGQLNDRRTMLGELNWIFTAITDTIAWNTLPRDLFQKLFRQDLLVASLLRNFLLAERVLRSYDCVPVSSPALPPTHQHPLWQAWDLALDLACCQLPAVLNGEEFKHAPFFKEQLTAFQVWLDLGGEEKSPPEQLPIVLQVLLSQVHRMRALELLARFLDLGPWAVNLALSVGIFPYVLKLLQSSAKELRPLLVFIWAKILAVDTSCQSDLVRENGHKYFLSVLQDPSTKFEHRTLAAFSLACIVWNYSAGQRATLQDGLVSVCLEQLNEPSLFNNSNSCSPRFKQWLALCLARLWEGYEQARWCGVRDSAHEKLYALLDDPSPEVRAAAVYALGTFISSVTERSEHANTIDQQVAMTLLNRCKEDMSWLVRRELVAGALHWMVRLFESAFVSVAALEEGKRELAGFEIVGGNNISSLSGGGMRRIGSRDRLRVLSPSNLLGADQVDSNITERLKRVASSSSISSLGGGSGTGGSTLNTPLSLAYGSVYMKLWHGMLFLDNDPHPQVAQTSLVITNYVRNQVKETASNRDLSIDGRLNASVSLPPSPNRGSYLTGNSPPTMHSPNDLHRISNRATQLANRARKTVPNTISEEVAAVSDENGSMERSNGSTNKEPLISTQYVAWASKYFAQPVIETSEESDPESPIYHEREWRYLRNAALRKESKEEQKRVATGAGRLESQVFTSRSPHAPTTLKFHPYDQQLAVAGKDCFSIWDWGTGAKLCYCQSRGTRSPVTRITSLEFLNGHDVALLLVASDDGTVKLWRPLTVGSASVHSREPVLVTAWQALTDLQPSTRSNASVGVVMTWEQQTQKILVTGDVRLIRVWDAETELRVCDIPTGADCSATCIDSDNSNLIVVGCGDGSVRLFDRRLSPQEARVMTWREHTAWVLGVYLRHNEKLISGSLGGDVRIFDIRKNMSLTTCQTTQGMTAMSVHKTADTFSCGSVNQHIGVYRLTGEIMNVIRFHEGFMGPRIGPVSCLTYHPHRVALAAGSMDSSVSVYSIEPKR
ncbi:regulatory-associated protein of mTOR [Chrysoperla carnea]|uniref:regulatory-associated protein of mTOR n=1 Tax=Chrysoperla carnea TaxID=189513 RepID=UPI001D06C9CF|nr:regulatory-associated protein of mTOR [Chrysoperla carnea]